MEESPVHWNNNAAALIYHHLSRYRGAVRITERINEGIKLCNSRSTHDALFNSKFWASLTRHFSALPTLENIYFGTGVIFVATSLVRAKVPLVPQ
jgi:hypothetical protein